jgi:hypothetical protein
LPTEIYMSGLESKGTPSDLRQYEYGVSAWANGVNVAAAVAANASAPTAPVNSLAIFIPIIAFFEEWSVLLVRSNEDD